MSQTHLLTAPTGKDSTIGAMDLISRYTCIRFVERTSTTATDYNLKHNGALLLLPGGWPFVMQELCVHELGHAMGQLHEQTSSLRYGHLRINWPSVPSDMFQWGPMTLDAPTIEFLDHKPFYMMKRSHSCTSVQLGTALRLLIATLKVMPSPCLGHGMELVSVSVMMVWTQRPDARPLPLKSYKTFFTPRLAKVSNVCLSGVSDYPGGSWAMLAPDEGCPVNANLDTGRTPDNRVTWPIGDYCILPVNGCPSGFNAGYVQLENECQVSGQATTSQGSLPDGQFSQHVKQMFCCRYDGISNIPMTMANTQPIVLLSTSSSTCQAINDCGLVIELNASRPMAVFTSPNYPNNYDNLIECFYTIRSPVNTTIQLNFHDFEVEGSGSSCDDSVQVKQAKLGWHAKSDVTDGLVSNFCRNPGDGLQPWCYTDLNGCVRDYCDVCLYGRPYDTADDCATYKNQGLCPQNIPLSREKCAHTCSDQLPQLTAPPPCESQTCPAPQVPLDASPSAPLLSRYNVDDEVTFQCRFNTDNVTSRCLSDGTWSASGYVCGQCPLGWMPYSQGSLGPGCLIFFSDYYLPYSNNALRCALSGAVLAEPRTLDAANFLAYGRNTGEPVWTGLSRDANGDLRWQDGSLPVYTNWAPGQPDNTPDKKCVVMDTTMLWRTDFCNATYQAACFRPQLQCPYGYQYYEGGLGCIRASTAAKTFDAADQECRAEGAVLARLPRLDAVSYFANFRTGQSDFWVNVKNVSSGVAWSLRDTIGQRIPYSECPFGYAAVASENGVTECYLYTGLRNNISLATAYCNSLGNILAEAKTASASSFISYFRGDSIAIWFGLRYNSAVKNWVWSNGMVATNQPWKGG
ncbi:hypothetical protein C0Q70_10293 [Pomacea canaliculata]|uniref:Metalloendopeptidase n=1 Tax=Pomacea canaliculata TaxID=400727 RepID=A0A2T7PC71_POMCA|nr:hypothetical protein C0Q70_10293 [Pomacea canaliculata]